MLEAGHLQSIFDHEFVIFLGVHTKRHGYKESQSPPKTQFIIFINPSLHHSYKPSKQHYRP